MGVLVWCGVCGGHYTRRGWGGFMTGMVEEGWRTVDVVCVVCVLVYP